MGRIGAKVDEWECAIHLLLFDFVCGLAASFLLVGIFCCLRVRLLKRVVALLVDLIQTR